MSKVFGEQFVKKLSVTKWSETDASLRHHLKSQKLSAELAKECKTAISWICAPLALSVPVVPVPAATSSSATVKSIPGTSNAQTSTEIKSQVFHSSAQSSTRESSVSSPVPKHDQFLSFETNFDADKVREVICAINVKTPEKMKKFAENFFNAAANSDQNCSEFTQLARVLDDEFNNSASSFKDALIAFVKTNFCNLLEDETAIHAQIVSQVKFIAELYKIGWIEGDFISVLMDGFAFNNFETHYQLNLFCQLLRVAALSMVKNGDCEKIADHHRTLSRKRESFKATKSYLMCLEVLEMLETMMKLENGSPQKLKEKRIREILFEIDESTAGKVKALPMETPKDFNFFVDFLIKKATADPDDAVSCAKLAVQMQQMKSVEKLLLESCQEKVLNFFNDGIKLPQLSDVIGLLRFIGELYIVDVVSIEFVTLCLELIIKDGNDDAADCLKVFLGNVGKKFESENEEKLSEIFEKFEEISVTEESYRAAVMTELIELRENSWRQILNENAAMNESTIEDILSKISNENLSSAGAALGNIIDQSDEKILEVIQALWKLIVTSNEPALYAKLCKGIPTPHTSSLRNQLVDFLHRRNITFRSIKKEEFTVPIKTRLGNVCIFIAELYNCNLISEEVLTSWIQLKLAKQLLNTSLVELISKINAKVSACENIPLKASMINLEGIAHEQSLEEMQELKEDIGIVTKIVNELQRNQKTKKTEAVKIEIV